MVCTLIIPDDVWEVICKYYMDYFHIILASKEKSIIEDECDIYLFDGGCFLVRDSVCDLFVLPGRRGKWRIRSEVKKFLYSAHNKSGDLKIRVHDSNTVSLRLVKFFGFVEKSKNGDFIELERYKWAQL
jgi:hypothetical protein